MQVKNAWLIKYTVTFFGTHSRIRILRMAFWRVFVAYSHFRIVGMPSQYFCSLKQKIQTEQVFFFYIPAILIIDIRPILIPEEHKMTRT